MSFSEPQEFRRNMNHFWYEKLQCFCNSSVDTWVQGPLLTFPLSLPQILIIGQWECCVNQLNAGNVLTSVTVWMPNYRTVWNSRLEGGFPWFIIGQCERKDKQQLGLAVPVIREVTVLHDPLSVVCKTNLIFCPLLLLLISWLNTISVGSFNCSILLTNMFCRGHFLWLFVVVGGLGVVFWGVFLEVDQYNSES